MIHLAVNLILAHEGHREAVLLVTQVHPLTLPKGAIHEDVIAN
jgi:hypothetical protein